MTTGSCAGRFEVLTDDCILGGRRNNVHVYCFLSIHFRPIDYAF